MTQQREQQKRKHCAIERNNPPSSHFFPFSFAHIRTILPSFKVVFFSFFFPGKKPSPSQSRPFPPSPLPPPASDLLYVCVIKTYKTHQPSSPTTGSWPPKDEYATGEGEGLVTDFRVVEVFGTLCTTKKYVYTNIEKKPPIDYSRETP